MRLEAGDAGIEPVRHQHVLAPALAAMPTEPAYIVGDRGQDVAAAVPDVAPPVAVIIDRIVEKARRHELGPAHGTSPRPGHLLDPDVPLIEDAQCRHQLAAKIGAATPVISQGGECGDRWKVPR